VSEDAEKPVPEKLSVYERRDGQLVRKLNDERDPARRYSAEVNVTLGTSRLIEYTDEEERARDAEERAWEQERPTREAAAKREAEEAEAFRASLKYEPRITAFLDILGWRAAVLGSCEAVDGAARLGLALKVFQAQVQHTENLARMGFPGDLQAIQFSDTIVFSASGSAGGEFDFFTRQLRFATDQLLFNGLLARGGICEGRLFHQGTMAFGPALITAYDLEQCAVSPRIIAEEGLGQRLLQSNCMFED
jgi:hypothetical protein